MSCPSETLDELKSKHGEIVELRAAGYSVLVKAPGRKEWKKFKTWAADLVKRIDAADALFRDCVVYPEQAEIEAMLLKKPALAELFGNEVAAMAGATEEVEKNVC